MEKIEYDVISLFNGMGCAWVALDRSGIKVRKKISSEIDKYAIKVNDKNYPETIQVGDVAKIKIENNVLYYLGGEIELSENLIILGGSPCTSFSNSGKGKGFEGESGLFWEFVRILKEGDPKYFLLENVLMKKEWEDTITEALAVSPIKIDSSLVSAQNRKRNYWTNIPNITQPEDRGILLQDILEDLPDCEVGIKVREKSNCIRVGGRNSPFGSKQMWDSPFQRISKKGKVKPGILKAACLTGGTHSGGNHSDMDILHSPNFTRRYSVIECERLQTLSDDFTSGVSNSQRFKMIGNGWTCDVIAHVLKNIPIT
jgi:DNA-cytosine methyltransferase